MAASFDSDKAAALHRHLHSHLPPEPALRVKALESLLVERGLVSTQTLDSWVEAYTEEIGPKRGAQVVARSWLDQDFRARLLENATEAIKEFGFEGNATGNLKAVENTDTTHNLVVCTLCSCYPFSLLGMSPAWYKAGAYRARAVREPRKVLKEFGVELSEDVAVRVWDSTAELRYLIVPQRPAGTEGWSEVQLAEIVTRNAMIGTDRDLKTGAA
ncbi:nitrile hydratase subunit alpha [Cochlodiniinecator piscidefendens]|uniref:nitrile hydratase subunit alpha n=1 Tax=Cochlodiniinecator piscidefendens TaxID=2715756 RepID=UPI00140AFF57|nr:nitrile hydratase subunit alpha [Cochlodiniinecator piscidefendens]